MQRFFISTLLISCLFAPSAVALESGTPVRVAFLGDFLPAGSAEPVIANNGYGYLFDGVRTILQSVDAVVLNLEAPISTRGIAVNGKTYTFRAHPRAAVAMAGEGVRAVWLANNHIMDFGVEGLSDTLGHLDAAGIVHAGAGMNVREAAAPAVLSLEGRNISLLSFSNTFPDSYWARENRPGTFFGAPRPVGRAVARALESDGGPVVASFHWGAELMTQPKEYQVDLARKAIDSGAALVVGHHPHVPQPIGIYEGVPILYSLGNFAFGSYSKTVHAGLLAVAEFGEEGRCLVLEIYPLLIDNTEAHFQPRLLTGIEGQRVFDPLVRDIDHEEADVRWDGEKGMIELRIEGL
jgi:poly-gamma-glutamate capsule biosynthesis protein CapA/YwtB (metallophosphatase superfamily)